MTDFPPGSPDWRRAFVDAAANAPAAGAVEQLAAAVRAGTADTAARIGLAAAFAHCAFAAPERIAATWDAAARGWLGTPDAGAAIAVVPFAPATPPAALWDDFWALVDSAGDSSDALGATVRTAQLGQHMPMDFAARAGAACLAFPGVAAAAATGYPDRFTMAALSRAPDGSLGHGFYRQIVDNGFDLEVLDRDALGLADLPFPLAYLNARILQLHDLLHLTGGYELTALHEIAISGFQMGQFGHGYSSMFLAFVMTAAAASPAAGGLELMLDIVTRGWRHGRRTPQLLDAPWEALWNLPLAEVRARLAVTPYEAPYPPNLFEAMRQAA
ncbi:MAG: Coq4 family protein [Polymorphobacter sp.]